QHRCIAIRVDRDQTRAALAKVVIRRRPHGYASPGRRRYFPRPLGHELFPGGSSELEGDEYRAWKHPGVMTRRVGPGGRYVALDAERAQLRAIEPGVAARGMLPLKKHRR